MTRRISPPDAPTAAALRAGAAQIGVDLDVAQADRLVAFAALLQRWNRVHNLTALDSPQRLLSHHLLDSLVMVPELQRVFAACRPEGEAARVLDVGSGAGLPGLVVAVALPQIQVTVLDAVQKKTAFLTQVRVELGLSNVDVVHARVEQFAHRPPQPFPVIVSRAFASLADFIRVTEPLLTDHGIWLAMKGRVPDDEIARLPAGVRVRAVIPLQVPGLAAERHLVEIVRAQR